MRRSLPVPCAGRSPSPADLPVAAKTVRVAESAVAQESEQAACANLPRSAVPLTPHGGDEVPQLLEVQTRRDRPDVVQRRVAPHERVAQTFDAAMAAPPPAGPGCVPSRRPGRRRRHRLRGARVRCSGFADARRCARDRAPLRPRPRDPATTQCEPDRSPAGQPATRRAPAAPALHACAATSTSGLADFDHSEFIPRAAEGDEPPRQRYSGSSTSAICVSRTGAPTQDSSGRQSLSELSVKCLLTLNEFACRVATLRTADHTMKIRNVRHKGIRRLMEDDSVSGLSRSEGKGAAYSVIPSGYGTGRRVAGRPGLEAHQLVGDQNGVWSLSVTKNWRITFRSISPRTRSSI